MYKSVNISEAHFKIDQIDQLCTKRMWTWIVQPTQIFPAFSHIMKSQIPATNDLHIWALYKMGILASSLAN